MNEENMIRVWRFEDAPPQLQSLSEHGGDEDWLAVVPIEFDGRTDMDWLLRNGIGCFGVCETSRHELPMSGRVVYIGAHA